jgi:hypothetical protein
VSQRLFHPDNDAIMQSTTVLTASPTVATMPIEFLQDQLRQKPVRWGLYTVDANNDKLDFNRGGVKVATLTHGTYSTPAAYATMVTARLEAADATPVWLVSYNATTDKFTIEDTNLGNFNLLWQSGTNAHRSCGIDLGFDVTADDTGTFTYTADLVSYQSRKYIIVNNQSGANIPATAAIILEHTATQVGSASVRSKVTIQGNATNDWSAPSFSEDFDSLSTVNALDNPNVPCVQYFATGQSLAYYRLVIDDVQHDISYTELGRFLLGTYSTVSICISDQIQFAPEDFSTGQEGIDGTAFASLRRHREVISMGWLQSATADTAVLRLFFDPIPAWRQWFFDMEVGTATELYYGYFKSRPTRAFVPSAYYDWTIQFYEAL